MAGSIAVNVATPGQATLTLGGLPPGASLLAQTTAGGGFTGWTAGASTVRTDTADGLAVDASSATSYVTRTVATAAGFNTVRVRALVALRDPEDIPVKVWVTDQTGVVDPENDERARYVGADPVWVEGVLDGTTATSIRIYVERPAGVTTSYVNLSEIRVWRHGPTDEWWELRRTDHNGTDVVVASYLDALLPSAGGALVVVDREAALGELVEWDLVFLFTAPATVTAAATLLDDDGYAMLHRPLDDSSTMFAVALVTLSTTRNARATVLELEADPHPAIASRPLSSRTGTFTLYTATLDDAELVADELALGELVMLRQPHPDQRRIDTYFMAETVEVAAAPDEELGLWQITGRYNETRRGVA